MAGSSHRGGARVRHARPASTILDPFGVGRVIGWPVQHTVAHRTAATPHARPAQSSRVISDKQATDPRKLITEAATACRHLLGGKPVEAVAFRAGPGAVRRSVKIIFEDGRIVVATCRSDPAKTRHEAAVLEALSTAGARVPRALAFDGTWLVQEHLTGTPLKEALVTATPDEETGLLDAAVRSLADIHQTARSLSLVKRAPAVNRNPADRVAGLIMFLVAIGETYDLAPPQLNERRIAAALRRDRQGFVNGDSSIVNAMVREDGTVAWYDWCDWGRGTPVDDLVTFLSPVFIRHPERAEEALLAPYLPSFGEADEPAAYGYLAVRGLPKICRQIVLAARFRGRPAWTDQAVAQKDGLPTPYRETTARLVMQGRRWAAWHDETAPLIPWFDQLHQRILETGK